MATDCTGLAVPEIAMQMLAKEHGSRVDTVFACDAFGGSQKWLTFLGIGPILCDMRIWNRENNTIVTRQTDGKHVKFSKESTIDLYVCGFVCTTPNGKRQAWVDEHAKTFWSGVKTISTVQPRVAILENVKAISNNANNEVVTKALSSLKDYYVCYLKLNSIEFGVPQHRPRIYMVAFCKDQLSPISFLARKINKHKMPQDTKINFRDFLKELHHPVEPSMQSIQSTQSADVCLCERLLTCSLHPCKCEQCKKHGDSNGKCIWKQRHGQHNKNLKYIIARKNYLLKWRKVKKDTKLKSAPSYFEIAAQQGVNVDIVTQPCRRSPLHSISMTKNINDGKCVLNLSKSLGRTQLRSDGLVPTLGDGCTGMFVPSAAKYLDVPQLVCLSGFKCAEERTKTDMDLMIGNTM